MQHTEHLYVALVGDHSFDAHVVATTTSDAGNALQEHFANDFGLIKLSMTVQNVPDSRFPMSPLDQHLPHFTAAAGTTIVADLRVDDDNNTSWHPGVYKARFLLLLQRLVGQRVLLAPLLSVDSPRLHRLVQVEQRVLRGRDGDDRNVVMRATAILPTDAAALNLEGVVSFLRQVPTRCVRIAADPHNNSVGLLGTHTAREWSDWLLGIASPVTSYRRRGYQILWNWRQHDCHESCYQSRHALFYSVRRRHASDVPASVATVLGGGDDYPDWTPCPWVDATHLIVPPLYDEILALQSSKDLHMPLATLARDNNATNETHEPLFAVQYQLLRSSSLTQGGTLLSRLHTQCAARVTLLQVVPPVVAPRWRDFALYTTIEGGSTSHDDDTIIRVLSWAHDTNSSIDLQSDGTLVLRLDYDALPARTTLTVALPVDAAFVNFESFPADANRGFELPPVRAEFTPHDDCAMTTMPPLASTVTLYSDALLYLAPLPDMSMPFNVLSLTCTLVAFVVGTLLNLVVRRASEKVKRQYDLSPVPHGVKERVRATVAALAAKVRTQILALRQSEKVKTE